MKLLIALLLLPLAAFAQTNGTPLPDMPGADVNKWVEYVLKFNDTFSGLPGTPLALVGCIVFGYFLKVVPRFQNRWIPVGVFGFGIVVNTLMTSTLNATSVMRGIILGLLVGAVAIVLHRKVLSKWIDDKTFVSFDTETITSPESKPTEPPKE